MSEPDTMKRERSPSFPYVGLEKAVERTRMLFAKAKRHEVRLTDAAADWGLGPKSSATLQTAAALLAFGLIEDSGSGESRKVKVSDLGWRILEDQRPGAKERLLAEAALKPKLIAEYAHVWRDGRPDDAHCVSDLKFDKGFNDEAASRFLRVFDETIRFTKSDDSDSFTEQEGAEEEPPVAKDEPPKQQRESMRTPPPPAGEQKGKLMAGERELVTGLLSKEASFRVIVSGAVGVKEIDRLIRKLELDKEILADADGDEYADIA
jgi:hypothetical protein